MYQLFFISIFINLLGGISLLLMSQKINNQIFEKFRLFLENRIIQSLIGITMLVVGILKLFIPASFGGIIVISDFLPAAVGFVVGIILLLNVFKKEGIDDNKVNEINSKIKPGYLFIGIGTILVSTLHFLFPKMIFL